MRLRHRAEMWLICSVWPIMGIAMAWGGWRLMMWSYGGREEFRRQVMIEPTNKEWFMVNPKKVFFREAPLSNVPSELPEELAALSPVDGKPVSFKHEHPHAR
eukprot:PhF_6_TR8384/c0_g1_i1/m.13126